MDGGSYWSSIGDEEVAEDQNESGCHGGVGVCSWSFPLPSTAGLSRQLPPGLILLLYFVLFYRCVAGKVGVSCWRTGSQLLVNNASGLQRDLMLASVGLTAAPNSYIFPNEPQRDPGHTKIPHW